MKNVHRSPFTVLLIVFVINSCSDDNTQMAAHSKRSYEQLKQEMQQAAQRNWEEFQEKHPEGKEINTNRGPEEAAPCNCSYRIESIEVPDILPLPYINAELWSTVYCDPENPFSCNYFSGLYFSGDVCGVCNFNPNCCDFWTELEPEGYFPFNCQVPAFSTFPVSFGIASYLSCSVFDDIGDWSVTFRIICQESEPNTSCGLGGGYGFVSEPITITYPGNAQFSFQGTTNIQLQECGCLPVEIE